MFLLQMQLRFRISSSLEEIYNFFYLFSVQILIFLFYVYLCVINDSEMSFDVDITGGTRSHLSQYII